MIKKTLLTLLVLSLMLFMVTCEETEPDTTPPAVPLNVEVDIDQSLEGEIYLVWDANTESDLAGYTVSRSISATTGFSDVATVVTNYYRDTGLDYENMYYYRVNAFDEEGNTSDWSTTTSGNQPFNEYPPSAPANLGIAAHNSWEVDNGAVVWEADIDLTWSANIESDFEIYRIYRAEGNVQFSTDDVVPMDSTTDIFYKDLDVVAGTTYSYKITAVDKGDKESQASLRVFDTPLIPPELISPIDEAVATSPTPELTWMDVYGADHYNIIVTDPSDNEVWNTEVDSDGSMSQMSVTYAGTALITNTVYDWYIKAFSKPPVEGLAVNVETFSEDFRAP